LVERRLTKDDDTAFADADVITLTNNGIIHLFSNIKYQLSEQEVESLFYPGQATTMLGLLKYTDDFSKSIGLNQLWYKDNTSTASIVNNNGFKIRQSYIILMPNPKGLFSFGILQKNTSLDLPNTTTRSFTVLLRLTLVRKADSDAIFKVAAADDGKIDIQRSHGLCHM